MKGLMGGLVGVGALIFCSGCGAKSESNVTCGTASACGGDIVGTWQIVSSCFDARRTLRRLAQRAARRS
jgi:hypothetical protein